MDARLRDRMRRSLNHNTVTLDEQPQSIPAGPFHWRTRTDARLHASRHNPSFDWAEASHDGYAPARHRRSLLRTARAGWLIVDEILGQEHHSATSHWHFDPSWMLTSYESGQLRATHVEGDVVWLLHDAAATWLVHGDEDSGLGWCAPAYGTLVPTWTAGITHSGIAPFAMVTWIGASGQPLERPPSLQRVHVTCDRGGAAIAARVTAGAKSSVFLLRPGESPCRDGRSCGVLDYHTNARALHYVTDGRRVLAVDVVDASHVRAHREGWFSLDADGPVADLHVEIEDGTLDLRASEPPAELRIEGSVVTTLRELRVNGREHPLPPTLDETLLVDGALWGEPTSKDGGLQAAAYGLWA